MMRDLGAAIDLHRVGDELDGLSRYFANGSDLVPLHDGQRRMGRRDTSTHQATPATAPASTTNSAPLTASLP